jgi:hypothetical protein
MSITQHEPAETHVETQTPEPWWQLPQIWGTAATIAMWLAVLFVGVYGGDMRFSNTDGSASSIPVVAVVAVCAALATAAVARRAYKR